MNFPSHKCGLYLTHNEHKDYYETVAQFIADRDFDFVSDEDKQKCLAENELWVLQWYPDTPVGFNMVAGSTLEIVLKAAQDENE